MATIREIASQAGVSVATVSNILNGKPGASPDTTLKVQRIVENLGYIPNMHAKNLKYHTTHSLGIIAEDLTVFNTPGIVDGIYACLEDRQYDSILHNLRIHRKYGSGFKENPEYRALLEHNILLMRAKQVDGILYVGCQPRLLQALPAAKGLPVVAAYCFTQPKSIPFVMFDDENAGYMATRHFIQAGHRSIGLIGGSLNSSSTQQRLRGYQRALFEAGIPYNPEWFTEGNWLEDSGYEACSALFDKGLRAFFCMNDLMADGVYRLAREKGLVVGRDLSVVGFDNRECAPSHEPPLTSVAIPLFEIGYMTAETMLNLLEGKPVPESTYIPCQLVCRQSVADLTDLNN